MYSLCCVVCYAVYLNVNLKLLVRPRILLLPQQVLNGYFVHFFSFDGLGLVSKQVMFVIDISGSMAGSNLQHTKSAVSYMLQQLQPFDHFNIMTFSNNVYKWRPNFVPAKPKYVEAGIRFLKKVNAHGGKFIRFKQVKLHYIKQQRCLHFDKYF